MLVRIMERDPLVRNSHAGSQNGEGSSVRAFTVGARPQLRAGAPQALVSSSGLSVLDSRFWTLGSGLSVLDSRF